MSSEISTPSVIKETRPNFWRDAACAVGFLIAVFVLYWPARDYEFVWDDASYLQDCPQVQAGLTKEGLSWAFQFSNSNWHPLVWLSWMLDVELFGFSPRGLRLTNYALHAINTMLLYVWLRKLTGRDGESLFVAAVFALHPLHIESVQWISERKDTLSQFFGLWTLLAWQRWLRVRSWPQYAVVCWLYVATLMSKQMFVTLPVLLLLLDYWPLNRWLLENAESTNALPAGDANASGRVSILLRRAIGLIVEKLPLFLIAVAFCVLAVIAQDKAGSVQSLKEIPLIARLANSEHVIWLYLGKFAVPQNLSILYPHPGMKVVTPWILLESAIFIAVTVALLRQRRSPYLAVGWLWYLIALLPVIGIVQIGYQQMADRYAYLPLIGVYWAATLWVVDHSPKPRERLIRFGTGLVFLGFLWVMARDQLPHWKTSHTLGARMRQVERDTR